MIETAGGSNEGQMDAELIARADPLLRLLTKSKISPILLGILYSLGLYSVRILAAWRVGHLRTVGTVTGMLDAPATYTNIVAGAVVWAYYTWMPQGIAAVFNGLHNNGVIGAKLGGRQEKRDFSEFIDHLERVFGQRWWSILSLVVSTAAILILVLPQYIELEQHASGAADPFSLVLAVLWVLIGLYCVLLQLVYSLLSIYWLRRLFTDFEVHVRPLHPDRSGGLSPLGGFTLRLSYLIALVGMMLVITPVTRNYEVMGTLQFRWTTELLVGLAAYIVGAPIVFFAPLSVAHQAMREAKNQLLLQISRRFESEYRGVHKALEGDISGLGKRLETLKNLETLHETTSKFPVWPFNVANLTRFGTTYMLPIAMAVLADLLTNVFS